MRINILTVFPDMINNFFNESIIKRASEKGIISVTLPPMGYKVVDMAEENAKPSAMQTLENNYLKVTVLEDGSIGSIYNMEIGAELLREPSNILYICVPNSSSLFFT